MIVLLFGKSQVIFGFSCCATAFVLTFDDDLLRCFHCWVVNQRAFVFTGGVSRHIHNGEGVFIFHFDHLSLQIQSDSGGWLVHAAHQLFQVASREWMEMICRHSGEVCAVYLQVEVKADGCGVPICHTLQRHIVSFYKRVLSDDLEGDVLCGVCADKMRRRWVVEEWRECVKWSVCPLQLAGETAETYSVAAPKRMRSCYLWPIYMQQSWLNLSDIYGHRSRSFKPQLFCCI